MSDRPSLFAPSRSPSPFPHALIPPESCERVLSASIGLSALVVGISDIILLGSDTHRLLHNGPFQLNLILLGLTIALAMFRGLPASVRYVLFNLVRLGATTSTLLLNGLTPSWPLFMLVFLVQTGLLFGVRGALYALGLVAAIFTGAALFWVKGPVSDPVADTAILARALDYHSSELWLRQSVFMFGVFGVILFMGWLVLLEMEKAKRQALQAVEHLAQEQEQRAKAEAARLKAELAMGETQKFDALGRMASGVAHDVNNALTVVKCWTTIIESDAAEPALQEALHEIKAATENAEHVMQHLLAFSRSDPTIREVVDLATVVESEGKTLRRLLPEDIAVTIAAEGPAFVRFGRGQLQRIILNLALNARDAMPTGGSLHLKVSLEQPPAAPAAKTSTERWVRLLVSDTGTGMDAATQARIFEPFFTTKGTGQGTGLGLAMVFGLVSGANGRLNVESQPHHGTTFTIFLPEADPSEALKITPAKAAPNAARGRVLIADDHTEIRGLIAKILTADGYPVTVAKDGETACAALAASFGAFDLLIVDGVMPGMPTRDVIARTLEHNPACKVILCSAHFRDELLLRGIDAGRYHRLDKPFSTGELREAVNRALA